MGHPFGPMFAHNMMDPQMFMPPTSNFMQAMPQNMPPPMSHLSPNMLDHQNIHNQLFQNFSNQFQPQLNNNHRGFSPSNVPPGFQKNRF